ncbi:hypothetical protein APICC_00530 [Apis cerana cerana]|uniref:Uncharacterized protein n=1 Tax=Apis cerana cerana TaxID=94128 RepID=A0A2A3EAJ2_APICC|nr:hypothetical protein APICC_00530 [Apis cerana cerana]
MTQFANFLPGTTRRISVIDLPRLSCGDSSKPIYDKGLPVFYLDCRYYMQLAIYAYYKIKSYNILLRLQFLEYVSEYNNSSLSYTFMIHFVTFRIGIFIYILEQAKVLGIRAITYQNIIIACCRIRYTVTECITKSKMYGNIAYNWKLI